MVCFHPKRTSAADTACFRKFLGAGELFADSDGLLSDGSLRGDFVNHFVNHDNRCGSLKQVPGRNMFRKCMVTIAATGLTLAWMTGSAGAHVEPAPNSVQKGTTAEITFTLEHGCGESPTTKLEIQVPDGVTNAKPGDKAGWTGSTAGNVVTFVGGPQPAHEETDFTVSFTFPNAAGTLHFPTVETCEVGKISWIEIPVEGSPEPEFVAPTVVVTDGVPTAGQLPPAEEGGGDEVTVESSAASTDSAASTETTTAVETTSSASVETTIGAETSAAAESAAVDTTVASVDSTTAASDDSDGGGNGGLIAGIVGGLVVVGGGAFVLSRRRK